VFLEVPRFARAAWRTVTAILFVIVAANPLRAQAPGGFVVSAGDSGVRAPVTAGEAQAFLPQRGVFTFPAPYGTQGIRITNASDCTGGDCVDYGYSYWNKINNHAGSDAMLVVVGLNRARGGSGPTLFTYNKNTGHCSPPTARSAMRPRSSGTSAPRAPRRCISATTVRACCGTTSSPRRPKRSST
jgi:hypothetical protein